MGRIRKDFINNFTVIHNEYLQDPNLGIAEIGMLTLMLSLPDGWDFSIEGLVHRFGNGIKPADGKTKIITALNKLKEYGYFRRIKLIDPETGRIVDWIYEFSDEKHQEWISTDTTCEYSSANPHADFPDMEKQPQSSTEESNTDSDDTERDLPEIKNEFINFNAMIKSRIEYERLCDNNDKLTIDRIKDVILDIMMSNTDLIRIGKADIPIADAKECFAKIEYKHVISVVERIAGKNIRSFKHYIRTSLYNAINDNRIEKPREFNVYATDNLALYADACDDKFNNEQMAYIENCLITMIPYVSNDAKYDIELERYNLLRHMFLKMMAENSKKPIRNKFKYMCAIIEKEMTSQYQKTTNIKSASDIPSTPSFNLHEIFDYAKNNTPTLKRGD